MSEIKISYKKWTIPDYRNGETEKDSRLIKLELESDIPELKGDVLVPDLLHSPVKCNEIYVNGKKVK